MKKLMMGALALGVIATNSYAGCTATKCIGKVDKLYMTANGTLYVGMDGDERSLNCTAPSNAYMSLDKTDEGKNAMYSLLLTAQTTKKPVTIRIKEGSPTCRIEYVTAN